MKRLIVVATAALLLATTASAAGPITGKVRGASVRNAYDGTLDSGNLKRYIKTHRRMSGVPGRTARCSFRFG